MNRPANKQLLLIDTDGGTDDCHGILVAASNPDVHILAITCVMGNVDIEQVCQNVIMAVGLSEKLKENCPIYKGAARPLAGFPFPHFNIHGKDGLGNVQRSGDVHTELQDEPACTALVRLVNQYPGQITIAALGPLTNLGLAMRIDPTFSSKIKDLVIMGGDSEGLGNITPCAEFNFSTDPEAARIVLREFTCPKTLISWELTLKYAWKIDWIRANLFINESRVGRFLRDTNEHLLQVCKENPDMATGGVLDVSPACDQLAVAVATSPHIVTESSQWRCTVETGGTSSRGHLVIDRAGAEESLKGVSPTKIVTGIDFEEFKQIGIRSLQA